MEKKSEIVAADYPYDSEGNYVTKFIYPAIVVKIHYFFPLSKIFVFSV
ncbi:MAG: hypothetical protein SOY48_05985 [Eubacterium sp.]|nr:hypothetical protein [Eubacterium sp.]